MSKALHPTYELFTVAGGIDYARELAHQMGGNLRAPHHTVSRAAIGAEIALAAGGVLLLDEAAYFSPDIVHQISRTWLGMVPACRPRIVVILRTQEVAGTEAARVIAERFAKLYDEWKIGTSSEAL